MKLTYWYAKALNNAPCYNLRAKTKKEIIDFIKATGNDPKSYGTPLKVVIEYKDSFDLLCRLSGEGGVGLYEDNE